MQRRTERVVPKTAFRPPLRALAAFEAAARLSSFAAAASELNLTPSAVSHQILALEKQLGLQLFARVGRGIELTRRGKVYLEKIQHILLALDEATRDLLSIGASEVVTVFTPPSLASKWLLPLLSEFMRLHPHVEVRVSAEMGRENLTLDGSTLAIIYRQPIKGERYATPLLEERIQPLCSPKILINNPVSSPSDLFRHVLISTNFNAINWKEWFNLHGVNHAKKYQKIQIDPSYVAIEAAAKEFGIALEGDVLAGDEIASGKLVTPLSAYAVRRISYVLAWSPDHEITAGAALLKDWLVAVAQGAASVERSAEDGKPE